MKLVFLLAALTPLLSGQQSTFPSLAPIRAEAAKAFNAEMERAAKGDCQNAEVSAHVNACLEQALVQSNANLKAYRAAIRKSIEARLKLFGPRLLKDFDLSEQTWDTYSRQQAAVTADLVDNPSDRAGSAAATRIHLIRTHMRELDNIYNILLHDNCGACLTDR